jgi:hypothetical protein
VFRRRRSADVSQDWPSEPDGQDLADDEFDEEADERAGSSSVRGGVGSAGQYGGPWDAGESFPPRDRVDLGSLHVPMGPEHEIQLVMADQHGAWVTIRHGESEMQVQAFAAARRSALWDDVRAEIAKEVGEAGGDSQEVQGSFGTELLARVPAEPGQPASGLRLVRFVGVDGPRWFLRGLLAGAAAVDPAAAAPLEAVFRETVVVRGDHPVPPRELLELRLPAEAAAALEAQAQAQQEQEQEAQGQAQGQAQGAAQPEEERSRFAAPLNPFERGPEFTETR